MEEVAAPSLADAGDVGKFVVHPGRYQNPACLQRLPMGEANREAGLDGEHLVINQFDSISGDLAPSGCEQFGRWHPVTGEEPVHVGCRSVARHARIDDGDAAAGSAEHKSCAEAGSAAADDHHVVAECVHVLRMHRAG